MYSTAIWEVPSSTTYPHLYLFLTNLQPPVISSGRSFSGLRATMDHASFLMSSRRAASIPFPYDVWDIPLLKKLDLCGGSYLAAFAFSRKACVAFCRSQPRLLTLKQWLNRAHFRQQPLVVSTKSRVLDYGFFGS
jgi:hypothetical protein